MWKLILIGLTFFMCRNSYAQLANGSVAPDFTLSDYYGNTHNLYDYLNDGKTVFVEIFAAHCPSCWSYHQTNTLKDLYNNYGPSGTNEVMVLTLEHDQYNDSTAFTGNHQPWVTAGDWLTGTPYPIFNVEGADRSVFVDYNVTYYPVVYKICSDKLTELISVSESVSQLYQKAQNCPPLSAQEIEDLGNIYIDQHSSKLIIEKHEKVKAITIVNLQGQVVKKTGQINANTVDISGFIPGIYIFQIQTLTGSITKKRLIQ